MITNEGAEEILRIINEGRAKTQAALAQVDYCLVALGVATPAKLEQRQRHLYLVKGGKDA